MTIDNEDLIADARQFADELDMVSFTAPDEETVRLKLGTIRKAASLMRLLCEDALEQSERARAAHDCVTAADRIIQRLEGRKNTCPQSSVTSAMASPRSESSLS